MSLFFQSHGGDNKPKPKPDPGIALAAPPALPDISVDSVSDFGYMFPPTAADDPYLKPGAATVADLDTLGDLMIESGTEDAAAADSTMPPVLTYWGQFLDHELTARTDRENELSKIEAPHPPVNQANIEKKLKNARSPRFDLDSVYGGSPIGSGITKEVATVISGMRHPTFTNKMRVGTCPAGTDMPDTLDANRDLPRYVQAQASVVNAAKKVAKDSMSAADFNKFVADLPRRALIGDQRNDENLIVAQFHLSFLRFHNKVVDFLSSKDTGWIADFAAAQTLTRLHYQWLIVEGYLKGVCDPAVVQKVVDDRASHFFNFRSQYDARQPGTRLGNAMPLEFSAAAFRFGHSMVRSVYDHNKIFGRPNGAAPFFLLFLFTGGGGLNGEDRLPRNWIIDWNRFLGTEPMDGADGSPARFARKIDTELAPPLGALDKEANDLPDGDLKTMFKQLARRNLRRGYNLRLPTGQALHAMLKAAGAVQTNPIADVSALFNAKPALRDHLKNSASELHKRTPLWFYILAEAEAGGGQRLGEVGSFLVASTFIGVLLADPDSALSQGFTPDVSPLRMPDNTPVDSIVKWMKFAAVMK